MRGITLWFTGLPCCGKTTIAKLVKENLEKTNFKVGHLDGDVVRETLTSDLGFSKDDRRKNLERVSFVAKLLTRNKVITLCTFVSPYRETRAWLRKEIGNFIEIYCKCSVEECARRDVKGMYAKAFKGEIKGFTGVDDPYEAPENAEIVLDTERRSEIKCRDQVLAFLFQRHRAESIEKGCIDEVEKD